MRSGKRYLIRMNFPFFLAISLLQLSETGQEAIPTSTSKKDISTRRRELLEPLEVPLVRLCCLHTKELLRSIPGSAVLKHVYAVFHSDTVVHAILDVCETDLTAQCCVENCADEELSILEDINGHRTIKNILVLDSSMTQTRKNTLEKGFATQFLARFESRLMKVAQSNRGAFIVTTLCQVTGLYQRVKSVFVLFSFLDEQHSELG